jgi:hypothetical protein
MTIATHKIISEASRMQRIPMPIEEYDSLEFDWRWKCTYSNGEAYLRPREIVVVAWDYARSRQAPQVAAIITTELSPFTPTRPLWPDYIPFDAEMRQLAREKQLTVFAHASDVNLGQALFGDEDETARRRPEWVERWVTADNIALANRMFNMAAALDVTPRELLYANLLQQAFPVVGILGLPDLLNHERLRFDRVSCLLQGDAL